MKMCMSISQHITDRYISKRNSRTSAPKTHVKMIIIILLVTSKYKN